MPNVTMWFVIVGPVAWVLMVTMPLCRASRYYALVRARRARRNHDAITQGQRAALERGRA